MIKLLVILFVILKFSIWSLIILWIFLKKGECFIWITLWGVYPQFINLIRLLGWVYQFSLLICYSCSLPSLCASIDDLSLVSSKTQVDVEFSGDKPCSIVIGKCRSINTTPFSVSKASDHPKVSNCITSINSRPLKFLGHIIHGSILYYYSFYLAKSTYFKKIKKINMI